MIAGIILAAGESTRMGSPKPLITFEGKTLLEHAVNTLKDHVSPLLVIVGHEAETVKATALPGVEYVFNAEYQHGQTSSLQAGLKHLADKKTACEAVAVSLIDHPGVTSGLVRQLTRIFKQTEPPIVIPHFQGHRGHPVIFSAKLFPELLALTPSQGANEVVKKYAHQLMEISTTETAVVRNFNQPSDLQ